MPPGAACALARNSWARDASALYPKKSSGFHPERVGLASCGVASSLSVPHGKAMTIRSSENRVKDLVSTESFLGVAHAARRNAPGKDSHTAPAGGCRCCEGVSPKQSHPQVRDCFGVAGAEGAATPRTDIFIGRRGAPKNLIQSVTSEPCVSGTLRSNHCTRKLQTQTSHHLTGGGSARRPSCGRRSSRPTPRSRCP